MKEKILVCENLEIFYKNNKIIDNLSFSEIGRAHV